MNRDADRAQIESEEVAAVNVRRTGDRDMSARNVNIDDLRILTPEERPKLGC